MFSIKIRCVELARKVAVAVKAPSSAHIQSVLFLTGLVLISSGVAHSAFATDGVAITNAAYNDSRIAEAVIVIMTHIQGSFGALIMVAAGIGAILSSAVGQYRAALGLLVVAVGAFILRSIISTFFNDSRLGDINVRDG